MTASQKINITFYIIMIIGVALVAFFLGFFSMYLFTEMGVGFSDTGGTVGDRATCDTSSLLNEDPTGIVLAGPLNLRKGPGLDYDVITTLEICTPVGLTGRSGDYAWLEVKLPKNVKGWVFSPYIQANININDLKVKIPSEGAFTGDSPSSSNSKRNASVIIERNQAVALVNGMPANEDIWAVLSPSNNANIGQLVAYGKTDAKGNATLIFSMPTTWSDGSPLKSGTMTLMLTAKDETHTVLLSYYTN
jgi:hypothetical protein